MLAADNVNSELEINGNDNSYGNDLNAAGTAGMLPFTCSKKIDELRQVLEHDIYACDAKWSIFVATVLSCHNEEILIPVPINYITYENKCDLKLLLEVIDATPDLTNLLKNITNKIYQAFPPSSIDLLHWVLVIQNEPTFRTLKIDEFFRTLTGINFCFKRMEMPTHIFEITYSKTSILEQIFQTRAIGHHTLYGLCGYSLDRVYSVLCHGFPNFKNSENKFGTSVKGLHLTNNLPESLKHCTSKSSWRSSLCGTKIRCIFICKYIDHPEYVSFYQKSNASELHIHIERGNLVLTRYVLFYGENLPHSPEANIENCCFTPIPEKSSKWKNKHWILGGLLAYGTVLTWMLFCRNKLIFK